MTKTPLAMLGPRLGLTLMGILIAPLAQAAEDGEAGLPQLDFSTWPTQIFWLVISFALAYTLMQRLVTPRIAAVLEERHARLENDMRMARQATDEAENLRMAFEKTLTDARMEASEKTRSSLAEAGADAEKKNAKAAGRIATRITKAEVRIAEAREAALKELGAVACEAALAATTALAGVKVTEAEAKKAVAQAEKATKIQPEKATKIQPEKAAKIQPEKAQMGRQN